MLDLRAWLAFFGPGSFCKRPLGCNNLWLLAVFYIFLGREHFVSPAVEKHYCSNSMRFSQKHADTQWSQPVAVIMTALKDLNRTIWRSSPEVIQQLWRVCVGMYVLSLSPSHLLLFHLKRNLEMHTYI